MSLDVYLVSRCEHCHRATEHYSANTTHNLAEMAEQAHIYEALWHCKPGTTAGQLAPILERGIADMKDDPTHYKSLDALNGWGTYHQFVPWLERLLEACKNYPDATVEVSI